MPIESLEDLTTTLKDHPQSKEILEFVSAKVEEEKQTGIALKRKANNEAQNLRKWKIAVEQLGYDSDEVDGLGEWIKQQAKTTPAPEVKPTPSGEPNPEIEKLRKEFKAAQKALDEERSNTQKIKQNADKKTIKAKLIEALRDKVYGHDLLAETLIANGQVKLTDDETVVFVNGEDELEFDKGVKKLLESRPDLLKNNQAPGARSSSRPSGAAGIKYTMEQIKSMSQEQIAADFENVKASMKALQT